MTEQEFNRAAERHLDMVYRIALNWLKRPADAEDAAQNVMLRLWRTDAAFAGGGPSAPLAGPGGGERVQAHRLPPLAEPDRAPGELRRAGV